MKMIPVLMYCDKVLVSVKELFRKVRRYLKNLFRGYVFVLMERDYVVSIHTPGVLSPVLLFRKPVAVYLIILSFDPAVRTIYQTVPFLNLFFLKDILKDVTHGSMAHPA